jgi:hypothetical protein
MDAAPPHESRGLALIAEHCARLAGSPEGRPTASSRLEQRAGEELARLLLKSLAGDHHRARTRLGV